MDESDGFFHVMTFNVQSLFDPGEAILDWNEVDEIARGANAVCDALLALPAHERPHVICLNEVLLGGASDIYRDRLAGDGTPWPYWAYCAPSRTDRLVAGAAIGAAVSGFVGLGPIGGATLGGALGGPLYAAMGGNSGVMILSRLPMLAIPEFASGQAPTADLSTHRFDAGYDAVLGVYSRNAGADDKASKGFLMVRVEHPRYGRIHVLATHMQASYADDCAGGEHHEGTDGCEAHSDVRAVQVAEIVTSIEHRLDPREPVNVFVAGDINIRGETGATTFVKRRNGQQWVSMTEYAAAFERVPNDPFELRSFAPKHRDAWARHRAVPPSAFERAGMRDEGFTNHDVEREEWQRLDYILQPERLTGGFAALSAKEIDIEAHRMMIRFDNLSDHRSLEAWFGPRLDFCSPALADVVADHDPAALDGVSTTVLLHDAPAGHRVAPRRWDWTLLDVGDVDRCVDDVKRHLEDANAPDVDPGAYCLRPGRAPGTYAVLGYLAEQDATTFADPAAVEIVRCADLSSLYERVPTARIEPFDGGSTGVLKKQGIEFAAAPCQVVGIDAPVYLRTLVPEGRRFALLVRRFLGDVYERALVAPLWRPEPTGWRTDGAGGEVGDAIRHRWYHLRSPRHSADHPFTCRVRIENPLETEFTLTVFDAPGQPRLVDGEPLHLTSRDATIVMAWTAAGAEDCRLLLAWPDAVAVPDGTRFHFEPLLTQFASKARTRSAITVKCIDETGWDAVGSDEILLRVSVDGQQILEMPWDDVDTGNSLPGAGCPLFDRFSKTPACFADRMDFDIVEIGDVGGRDRGRITVSALADGEDDRAFGETTDVGSGEYRLTGTACRDADRDPA